MNKRSPENLAFSGLFGIIRFSYEKDTGRRGS